MPIVRGLCFKYLLDDSWPIDAVWLSLLAQLASLVHNIFALLYNHSLVMSNLTAFNRVKAVGIIPAIRSSVAADAIKASEAIRLGGIDIIEVSLAPGNALACLAELVRQHSQSMLIGAGSVVGAQAVRKAADAGAQFIVTPGFDQPAVDEAKRLGLAAFVGALTPTEVQVASASGADAVKIFPCFANGDARYMKALRSQYPDIELIASGGVGMNNCGEYVRAGACAIGVGGEIVDAESLSHRQYRVFTVRAKRLLDAVKEARSLLEQSLAFV